MVFGRRVAMFHGITAIPPGGNERGDCRQSEPAQVLGVYSLANRE
jgi:hypothetical protein